MKNNSVIRLNTAVQSAKPKARVKSGISPTLSDIDRDVNQLWQMYQSQLQRNGELLVVIDRQQQFIQQVISQGAMNLITPPHVEPVPTPAVIPLPEFKDLTVEMLNEHVIRFKDFFKYENIKRLDGMHAIIKMLYTLNQTGGIAYPEQLFEKCNIGKSTGFRHASFLQNKLFIKRVGGKYDTRYKISLWGKQFLDGTLQKEYSKTGNHLQIPE